MHHWGCVSVPCHARASVKPAAFATIPHCNIRAAPDTAPASVTIAIRERSRSQSIGVAAYSTTTFPTITSNGIHQRALKIWYVEVSAACVPAKKRPSVLITSVPRTRSASESEAGPGPWPMQQRSRTTRLGERRGDERDLEGRQPVVSLGKGEEQQGHRSRQDQRGAIGLECTSCAGKNQRGGRHAYTEVEGHHDLAVPTRQLAERQVDQPPAPAARPAPM